MDEIPLGAVMDSMDEPMQPRVVRRIRHVSLVHLGTLQLIPDCIHELVLVHFGGLLVIKLLGIIVSQYEHLLVVQE